MTKYAFLTKYKDQTGVFVAESIKEAREIAWDSLKVMIPEPDPSWFVIEPMTKKMLDEWDGAPLEHFEPFEPWPEPISGPTSENEDMINAFIKTYGPIGDPLEEGEWHSWLGIWVLSWGKAKSYYTGPNRPATQIEIEAMGAISNLQDELREAREIIKNLLRALAPYSMTDPVAMLAAHKKATQYLKPKPLKIIADGDEA